MIRLMWRFFLLAAAALAFSWLADRPGSISVNWMGRQIEMSVVVGMALLIAITAILIFAWHMFRQIWRSPGIAREYLRFRRQRKGYESLSRGIIAAGAGDAQAASRHAAAAGNALSDEPLVNVLAAQAAQLSGDREGMRKVFESMTRSAETEILGLRGLFAEARASGDLTAALRHAERALALNPRLAWASTAVLQVQTARKSWEAAALTLDQQARSGLLDKTLAAPKRAALLTAEAQQLEDSNRDRALTLASEAHGLDPSLVPAACVVARCHIAKGSPRKAAKVLRATWALSPHPDLAELLARTHQGEGPEARFERLRDAIGDAAAHVEAAVALARAALAAKRFEVARESLQSFSSQSQARICALMAKIEEASGDKGRAREWLARAIHAPRDPMWVSDGVANTRWVPVSPVTGEIVPCEWKVPYELLPVEEADAPAGPAEAEAAKVPTAAPGAAGKQPRMADLPRPPDDPGIATAEED